jgi:cytochrome c556
VAGREAVGQERGGGLVKEIGRAGVPGPAAARGELAAGLAAGAADWRKDRKPMRQRWATLALAAAVVLPLALASGSAGQVKKGKTRPVTTEQLMEGLVNPNCGGLAKAMQGSGPSDDKAWQAVALQAALLNEASYVLMADGRCPDAVWAGACDTLGKNSTQLLVCVQSKDAVGAKAAFTALTGSCKACHSAHRK